MTRVSSILPSLLSCVAVLGIFRECTAQPAAEAQRWDLQMIAEAPIWKNLLVKYTEADHKKNWPERRAALRTIVDNSRDSRWTDDAELVLACGKASFMGDPSGAIMDLQEIAKKYSAGQTVVVDWASDFGCHFDRVWLMWQGGLVFLDEGRNVRLARPFDNESSILPQQEKEALAYFDHIEKHPRRTPIVARLLISKILLWKQDTEKAMDVLSELTSSSTQFLVETSKADESAASKPDGHYLRCLWRPECEAYLMLMRYYESRKDTDKAIAKAQELIQRVSPDGWHWELNKAIGDFYKRNGLEDEAKQQYRLALASVRQYIEIDKGHRDKLIDRIVATAPSGAPLPSDMEKIATDLEKMNSGTK